MTALNTDNPAKIDENHEDVNVTYVCRYCGFAVPNEEDIKLHLVGGHPVVEENCSVQHIDVVIETDRPKNWVVVTVAEGGSHTVPHIVLPRTNTGRRWRITYEEMIDDE